MSRLLNLTEVTLEWGSKKTRVYVENGIIEWTDEQEYKAFRGSHLSQLAYHIRVSSGCKVILHSTGNSGITEVTGARVIHRRRT
jgi:hypothetical protein